MQPARSYHVSQVAQSQPSEKFDDHMKIDSASRPLVQHYCWITSFLDPLCGFRMTGVVFFGAGSQEMRSPASSSRQMFQTGPVDALDSVSALPLPSLPLRTGV